MISRHKFSNFKIIIPTRQIGSLEILQILNQNSTQQFYLYKQSFMHIKKLCKEERGSGDTFLHFYMKRDRLALELPIAHIRKSKKVSHLVQSLLVGTT